MSKDTLVPLAAALETLVSHGFGVKMMPNDCAIIVDKQTWIPEFFEIHTRADGWYVDGDRVAQICHPQNFHPMLIYKEEKKRKRA